VPIDKTNNFVMVESMDYACWVKDQLDKMANEVKGSFITSLHENAEEFSKQIDFLLSDKERERVH